MDVASTTSKATAAASDTGKAKLRRLSDSQSTEKPDFTRSAEADSIRFITNDDEESRREVAEALRLVEENSSLLPDEVVANANHQLNSRS